jgi:hypothetical protein
MSKKVKTIASTLANLTGTIATLSPLHAKAKAYAEKIVVREGGVNKRTKAKIAPLFASINRHGVILGSGMRLIRHDIFVDSMVRFRAMTADEASKVHGEMQHAFNKQGIVGLAQLAKATTDGEYNITRLHQNMASGTRTIVATATNKRIALREALVETGHERTAADALSKSLVSVGVIKA